MTPKLVPELEKAIEAFTPDPALKPLLLFRLLTGEFIHRVRGGQADRDAADDVARYVATLEQCRELTLSKLDLARICEIHAMLLGERKPSSWRSKSVAVRFNRPGSRLWLAGAAPHEIGARLAEMHELIIRNSSLTRFERIALLHLELIRTHPFQDGNGRLCRLIPSALVASEFESNLYLGITRIMRSNFVRYNAAIRNQRESVYEDWIRYFSGAIASELHAAQRIDAALSALSPEGRSHLEVLARTNLERMRFGHIPSLSETLKQNILSQEAKRIVTALY